MNVSQHAIHAIISLHDLRYANVGSIFVMDVIIRFWRDGELGISLFVVRINMSE